MKQTASSAAKYRKWESREGQRIAHNPTGGRWEMPTQAQVCLVPEPLLTSAGTSLLTDVQRGGVLALLARGWAM